MMMPAKDWVNLWLDLIEYCKSAQFDKKEFRYKHDNLAKIWGRFPQDHQGLCCELISKL